MAKFTKLNIGEAVASVSGRVFKKLSTESAEPLEQLPAPYGVTINGDDLTFGDYSCLATEFDILVDGVVKATTTSTSFDLLRLALAQGTYSITVIAKADGYANSEPSEAVTYTKKSDNHAGGSN